MQKRNRSNILIRQITLIAIGIITVSAILITFYAQQLLTDRTDKKFAEDTTFITRNVINKIQEYDAILYNARAFIASGPDITQSSWQRFFDNQHTLTKHPGISAISYAEVITHQNKQSFVDTIRKEGTFGPAFTIQPAGDRPSYLVAHLIASNKDISKGYGFDNFSTADRHQTYINAEKYNRPAASAPFTFATGHPGFFVTLPVMDKSGKKAQGFIIMSFRLSDLTNALYKVKPPELATAIIDVTDNDDPYNLFQTKEWEQTNTELTRVDSLRFADRIWKISYRSTRTYNDGFVSFWTPIVIAITASALVLSIVLCYGVVQRRYGASASSSS